MKKILITVFLLLHVSLISALHAETVYKKVNPDGSVEFTDRDSKNSEEIKIREPQTYTPTKKLTIPPTPKSKQTNFYSHTLSINSPSNDSTVVGQQNVTVSVSVEPKLKNDLQIRYQLGEETTVTSSMSHTFINVYRGTHTVTAQVINSQGVEMSPQASVIFHMKRFFKKKTP